MLRPPNSEKPVALTTPTGSELSSSFPANDNSDTSKSPSPAQRALDPRWHAQRRWNNSNPVARRAHYLVGRAIKKGILVPPERCEKCGQQGRIEAHHEDHECALDVAFWCAPCHRRHHALLRKGGA